MFLIAVARALLQGGAGLGENVCVCEWRYFMCPVRRAPDPFKEKLCTQHRMNNMIMVTVFFQLKYSQINTIINVKEKYIFCNPFHWG